MAAMPDDSSSSVPDLGGLLDMAMDLQQQVVAAQQRAADHVVTGQAGGGVVRIEVTGAFEFRSVVITPEAVEGGDVEMVQDLVLAALRDAVDQVGDVLAAADPLADMGGAAGVDLGALDLGGLVGALGVGDDDEDVDEDDENDEDVDDPGGDDPDGSVGAGPP